MITPKLDLQVPNAKQDFHPFFTLLPSPKRNILCSLFIFTVKNFGNVTPRISAFGGLAVSAFLGSLRSTKEYSMYQMCTVQNIPPLCIHGLTLAGTKKKKNQESSHHSIQFCVTSWFWWHTNRAVPSFVLAHHQFSFSFEIKELRNYFPWFSSGIHQGEWLGIRMGQLGVNRPKIKIKELDAL